MGTPIFGLQHIRVRSMKQTKSTLIGWGKKTNPVPSLCTCFEAKSLLNTQTLPINRVIPMHACAKFYKNKAAASYNVTYY